MPNPSNLIFITGAPRSGTTWLNRELCHSDNTNSFFPECSYLTAQVEILHNLLGYGEPKRVATYFKDSAQAIQVFKAILDIQIDKVMQIQEVNPDSKVILKDPNLCLYLDTLGLIYPEAKIVVIVRDPRDVLASFKQVVKQKKQPWSIQAAIHLFQQYYGSILKIQNSSNPNLITIQYHEALEDLSGLVQQLALNRTKKVQQVDIANRLDSQDPFYSPLYVAETTKQKIGSYKKLLSADECYWIERSFAQEMACFDYPKENITPSLRVNLTRALNKARTLFGKEC